MLIYLINREEHVICCKNCSVLEVKLMSNSSVYTLYIEILIDI